MNGVSGTAGMRTVPCDRELRPLIYRPNSDIRSTASFKESDAKSTKTKDEPDTQSKPKRVPRKVCVSD